MKRIPTVFKNQPTKTHIIILWQPFSSYSIVSFRNMLYRQAEYTRGEREVYIV